MVTPAQRQWIRAAALVAVGYVAVGVTTASVARLAPSPGIRTLARLAAWGISVCLFVWHIGVERRRKSPAHHAARHTSAAVASATFVLAGVAVWHQLQASHLRASIFFALAVWPILTGVVSVALADVVFLLLSRMDARRSDDGTP